MCPVAPALNPSRWNIYARVEYLAAFVIPHLSCIGSLENAEESSRAIAIRPANLCAVGKKVAHSGDAVSRNFVTR